MKCGNVYSNIPETTCKVPCMDAILLLQLSVRVVNRNIILWTWYGVQHTRKHAITATEMKKTYSCLMHKINRYLIILKLIRMINMMETSSTLFKTSLLIGNEKKEENSWIINGHFTTIFGPFLPAAWKSFTKLRFRRSF